MREFKDGLELKIKDGLLRLLIDASVQENCLSADPGHSR